MDNFVSFGHKALQLIRQERIHVSTDCYIIRVHTG